MLKYSSPVVKYDKSARLKRIQCMYCLTIYSNNLEIEWVGISNLEGKA